MSNRGDSIRKNISDAYEKTVGYLVYDITEAIGQEMDEMEAEILNVQNKLDVNNLSGDELERFISQHKGISRKAATNAIGSVTVTGNGTVAIGDLFETANGVQFRATAETAVTDSAVVPVECVTAGNVGVVGSGTITQFPITLSGIITVTNEEATHDGYDAEADEELLDRYLIALRTPASSGNKYDYRNWAIEVTGVGGAEIFPLGHGNNTVDVVIIDNNKTPASNELVGLVQNHIDPNSEGKGNGTAPIGAKCYVSSATATTINVSAKVSFKSGADTSAIKQSIESAIANYLKTIAFTGSAVSYAQIGNQIIDTEGVIDYENLIVNDGTSNIQINDRYVAVLGSVIYA